MTPAGTNPDARKPVSDWIQYDLREGDSLSSDCVDRLEARISAFAAEVARRTREETLEEAMVAARDEAVMAESGEPSDFAYNRGVSDAANAVRALMSRASNAPQQGDL